MGLPVRQVGGLARHAEPWRGLAWRHRSPRGLSAPAGKRTPVSVLNCWRGAQAGPPRPGPASPTRMWPTRGERAQTPSSRPPCAPSLEAQRLPPKSPLLRWTVPNLGDAGGGGGAATALRSQSSSKQRQCHRRPEPTRDRRLPPLSHSIATERGARTSRLRLGWSAQVLRCLRLGPPKGCPQQEPQPGRASPLTLDWAGEPAGGGPP